MTHTNSTAIRNAYSAYLRSDMTDIYHAYAKPSTAKFNAWLYCHNLMMEADGRCLRVIGYNTCTFSAGFIGTVDGKMAFVWITKTYERYAYLDELNA